MEPPFIPEYRKPRVVGISTNIDNTVSIYHIIREEDSFDRAAGDTFALVKKAQEQFPDRPRILYLDIEGHGGAGLRFNEDFVEFQQELFFSTMAVFLTAFDLPLTGPLVNPDIQRNDLPDELVIAPIRSKPSSHG
jgi:hypothetical protein